MNTDIVGREAEPFRLVVEEGKVREFARATNSSHPDHLREDDPVSPVTFLMTSAFWQGPEAANLFAEIGLDMRRVLHGGQGFVFHGPPPSAGTVLTGRQRVDAISEKEGKRGGTMTFVDVVTEYRDESGDLVAEVTSTVIQTSKPPSDS